MSICLVHMPYAAVERPSIGLGILQSALREAGLASEVVYANLMFAERMGLSRYKMVEFTPTDVFVGEWTFAGAAFPDFTPDHDEYMRLADIDVCSALYGRDKAWETFWSLRDEAPRFIDELARDILRRRPRIVGAGSTFQQHCASLALLRRIRELDPTVVTMLGGANCESAMGAATHRGFPWVDYVVSGEADEIVGGLCRRILEKGRDVAADEVPTCVIVPAARGRRSEEVGRGTVARMDVVPVPDYDAWFETLDRLAISARIAPGLLVETSRGCWWGARHHCTFCGLNGTGMGYRSKSPRLAVESFEQLSRRYGMRSFEVVDNILDMGYIRTVLPALAGASPPYRIFFETKANLRREHVQALAEAGVTWIQPGIESMHDQVLGLIDKGCTALTNVALLKWTREFGIRVSWNFLGDFPGEDDAWYAEMAEWLPLVSHLQPPQEQSPIPRWTWKVTRIRYERFSPYHTRPEKYGITLGPNRYYPYVYPLPPHELNDIAYFFEEAGDLAGPPPHLRAEERPGRLSLESWVDAWIRRFWKGLPIILSMTDDGSALRIIDTRACAVARTTVLEGLTREVYLLCDTPQTERSVVERLRASGSDDGALEVRVATVLGDLRKRKLVLALNGKHLSLAVRGDLPPFPRAWEFPGGAMDVEPSMRPKREVRA